MIWPFLLVYVGQRLEQPLTITASLMTVNSIMGLIASFFGGPIIDRFGRKWMMAASLLFNGLAYFFMGNATTFLQFALLLAITGSFNPLYRIGADAMMADLLPKEQRIDGYSLLRLSNNLGIAIGPAIGGFIASNSYSLAFYLAGLGLFTYSGLIIFFAKETLPEKIIIQNRLAVHSKEKSEKFGGYLTVFSDLPYVRFIISFILITFCSTLIWVLLPVHATENYSVPMQLYGFIPAANAIMVVFLQLFMTKFTRRFPPLPVIAIGGIFYSVAVGAIAWMQGFWGFLLCMVIMTIGELILVPTSSTFVANRAPTDMRGRYMSLYALTWGVSLGIAPVFGGFLNDLFGPTAIWLGGAVVGWIGVLSFLLLDRQLKRMPSGPMELEAQSERLGIG